MKIQSINQSSPRLAENKANNKQQNFKGLVKLIDIGGEKLVMDAKKIVGVYEHPIQFSFHCNPCRDYRIGYGAQDGEQFHHVKYDGINVVYESLFTETFIDSLPTSKRDFLASRIVKFAASIDEFTEFLEKALATKKTMTFGLINNPFLEKVREIKRGGNMGEFFGTPLEDAMRSVPGYITDFEDGSEWWI